MYTCACPLISAAISAVTEPLPLASLRIGSLDTAHAPQLYAQTSISKVGAAALLSALHCNQRLSQTLLDCSAPSVAEKSKYELSFVHGAAAAAGGAGGQEEDDDTDSVGLYEGDGSEDDEGEMREEIGETLGEMAVLGELREYGLAFDFFDDEEEFE